MVISMTTILLCLQMANERPVQSYDTVYVSDYSDIQKDITFYDIKAVEGCTYTFIVPGDISGPTIGTGLDIGNMGVKNINLIFKGIVSDSILKILLSAHRVVGVRANAWISSNNIRLNEAQVRRLANRLIKHYWSPIPRNYPCADTMKPSAKLGILSYAIHVGRLDKISKYLKTCNYVGISAAIEHDKRNPERRYREASLVKALRVPERESWQ